MSFLAEYGIFLAKTATLAITIIVVFGAIIAMKSKDKESGKGKVHITKLNEEYDTIANTVKQAIATKQEKKAEKKAVKAEKKQNKHEKKTEEKHRLFVLNFHGDIRASAVSSLQKEITAVLLAAKPNDRVLVKLESAGGMVNAYGLAAAQLQRLRDAKIHLTIAIDKVAASGGYMMACVAEHIIAAPFSIIGSIGVIAQLPNMHKLLQKNHIDFEQITAGEYKRTLTVFGENTPDGRKKLQAEVNETHDLFKDFIKRNRATVNLDEVATGEHWFAEQAISKALVDKLQTSDDYLLNQKDSYDMYAIQYKVKKPLAKKLGASMQAAADYVLSMNKSGGQDFI